jgi:hypothetical protein
LAIIEGALGMLNRVSLLQMELSVVPIYEGTPTWTEVARRLADLDFSPSGVFPVSRAADGLRVLEFDGVFVRMP